MAYLLYAIAKVVILFHLTKYFLGNFTLTREIYSFEYQIVLFVELRLVVRYLQQYSISAYLCDVSDDFLFMRLFLG
jgi:hypothetical protein